MTVITLLIVVLGLMAVAIVVYMVVNNLRREIQLNNDQGRQEIQQQLSKINEQLLRDKS